MSYLCYCEIHLLRFICCYCTSIYNKYVVLLCIICNHHKTFLISEILNQFLCNIYKHNYSPHTTISTTSQKLRSPKHSKHWNTELYRWSDDHGEGYHDSYLNRLDSFILTQYTTVTNKRYLLPWTWNLRIQYCDRWSNF